MKAEDRFWTKVDKSGECWVWTAAKDRRGYGVFHLPGANTRAAHRISFKLAHGDVPTDLCVLHTCDNPPCVNPAHLRLGTQADNLADMTAKGRRVNKPLVSHCKFGHAMIGDNVIRYRPRRPGLGWERGCRACMRIRSREHRRRERETNPERVRARKREYARRARERQQQAA